MDNKYFGTITHPNFLEWDKIKQDELLLDLGLFTFKYSISTKPIKDLNTPGKYGLAIPISENNKTISCKPSLSKNVYKWLLKRYESYLTYYPVMFEAKFNNSVFGYNDTHKKQFALDEFNRIYKDLIPSSYLLTPSRFEALHHNQQFLVSQIEQERDIVLNYLTGQEIFFNVPLFESNSVLQSIIEFEGNLKILHKLNTTYEFEVDHFINDSQLLNEKFKTLEQPSYDINIFKFIEEYMVSIKKSHYAHTVSLFFFLRKLKLISETADDFRSQIQTLYGLKLSKLKLAESSVKKHELRIKDLEKRWDIFKKA